MSRASGAARSVVQQSAPRGRGEKRSVPLSSAQIAEQIKLGIQSGRFAPGQRLIEADLMNEFGVKRGPVREALRVLSGDGIVEHVPQKGVRVRKLEREDFFQLMPVLAGLLRTAIRLAAPKLGKAPWRERLEQAMEAMRSARRMQDFAQFQLAGMRYADVLFAASENRYLGYLHAKLYPDLFYRQFTNAVRIEDWDSYLDYFERTHRACLAGDAAKAEALISEHEAKMFGERAVRGGDPLVWR